MKRKKLAPSVEFVKYMKEWRFKKIKQFIPRLIEEKYVKEIDDWYTFKGRVELFVDKNKEMCMSSSILVFDKLMSAYIPR